MHDGDGHARFSSCCSIAAIALITIDFRDGGQLAGARDRRRTCSAPSSARRAPSPAPLKPLPRRERQGQLGNRQPAEAERPAPSPARAGPGQRRQEQAQLSQLLHLTNASHYRVVTATVIAAGGDYSDTVTINAGSPRRHHDERDRAQRRRPGRHRHRRHRQHRDRAARHRRRGHGRRPDGGTNEIGAVTGTGATLAGSAAAEAHPVLRDRRAAAGPDGRDVRLGGRPPVRAWRARRHGDPGHQPAGLADPDRAGHSRSPTSPASAWSAWWSASDRAVRRIARRR